MEIRRTDVVAHCLRRLNVAHCLRRLNVDISLPDLQMMVSWQVVLRTYIILKSCKC